MGLFVHMAFCAACFEVIKCLIMSLILIFIKGESYVCASFVVTIGEDYLCQHNYDNFLIKVDQILHFTFLQFLLELVAKGLLK